MPEGHVSHDENGPVEHTKHVQLGVDPDAVKHTSRKFIPKKDRDAVWEDAVTVEQYKEDIEALREAGWPVGT